MPPDAIDELEAIDEWHAQVGDEDIRDVGIQLLLGVGRRRCGCDAGAGGLEDFGHQSQGIRLVVHREHEQTMQIGTSELRGRARSRVDARGILADGMHDHDRNLQPERGPLIESAARCLDRSAVHFRQLAGD
jgi:hypothetical protein